MPIRFCSLATQKIPLLPEVFLQKRKLTFAELFATASTAETVVFALFFAWVALHEAGLLEHWAEFWEFGHECARDGELDSVDLSGHTAAFDADGNTELFLLLSQSEWIGDFGHQGLVAAQVFESWLVVDDDFTFTFV